MSRRHRPHLPGAVHHVAARTQFCRELFSESLRPEVEELLKDGVASGGAQLVAHAIMPTHFHALIIQGQAPLGCVLQPVMRRLALLVQRCHGFSGHAFERRFRSRVCDTAQHRRNSVLYIHRNPLAARLCSDVDSYPWTSHRDYASECHDERVFVRAGLEFVAGTAQGDDVELRDIYVRSLAQYCGCDDDGEFVWTQLPRQARTEMPFMARSGSVRETAARMADLRDVALILLRQIAPGADVELIRSNFKGRQITAFRRELMAALLQRDFAVGAIGQYLRISDTCVSRVKSELRWGSKYRA